MVDFDVRDQIHENHPYTKLTTAQRLITHIKGFFLVKDLQTTPSLKKSRFDFLLSNFYKKITEITKKKILKKINK